MEIEANHYRKITDCTKMFVVRLQISLKNIKILSQKFVYLRAIALIFLYLIKYSLLIIFRVNYWFYVDVL